MQEHSYQNIEKLENAFREALNAHREKHKPLKAKLKELLEQLNLTFNSNKKFEILNEMKEIEDLIKKDEKQLSSQKEHIEKQKAQLRKSEYIEKTRFYQQKEIEARQKLREITKSPIQVSNETPCSSPVFSVSNWLVVLNLLCDEDFLSLVEMLEKRASNHLFFSSLFWNLYSLSNQLDFLDNEIKACLKLFD